MKGSCEECNTTKCKFIPTETLRSGGLNTMRTGNGVGPERPKVLSEVMIKKN